MPRTTRPSRKEHRRPTFIRAWRKHEGLTLEKLSERLLVVFQLEVSDGQLSRIERGDQPYTQDLLEAIAAVLRCEPADLLRRGPEDAKSIALQSVSTEGLEPEQTELLHNMAAQMRKAG